MRNSSGGVARDIRLAKLQSLIATKGAFELRAAAKC